MGKESVTTPHEAPCTPVMPLPIALYESDGLIFELYDGGQPCQPVAIRWERLKPVAVIEKICNSKTNDKEESGNRSQSTVMKLINFLAALRQAFHQELSVKTGWGREELKAAFERAISSALAQGTTLE